MDNIPDRVEEAGKLMTLIEKVGLPIALSVFFVLAFTGFAWILLEEYRGDKKVHREDMAGMVNEYKNQAKDMSAVVEANTKAQVENSMHMTSALKSLETEIKRIGEK